MELVRLAECGCKRLLLICPSFVADCLETLEGIGIRGRAMFQQSGGRDITLIPCLNDQPQWIMALAKMIERAFAAAAP
jgi:ferrochelatase